VSGAIQSKYRNSGQNCVCANRFLVRPASTMRSWKSPRRPRS
jgi:acyl-CoA reductase-like NAD-dependent aldehyde dehydrogenase